MRGGNYHKHDMSHTKLYRCVWTGVKQRCLNSKTKDYERYGGRGITICDEWKKDFVTFYNWAMNNGYKEGLEIDRIDNDGNYEPKNCRFVTPTVNIRKQSQTKLAFSEVMDIRNAYSLGCFQQKEIANAYGVSTGLINLIVNNKIWLSNG